MNNFISIEYKCLKVYGNFLIGKSPYTFGSVVIFLRSCRFCCRNDF